MFNGNSSITFFFVLPTIWCPEQKLTQLIANIVICISGNAHEQCWESDACAEIKAVETTVRPFIVGSLNLTDHRV